MTFNLRSRPPSSQTARMNLVVFTVCLVIVGFSASYFGIFAHTPTSYSTKPYLPLVVTPRVTESAVQAPISGVDFSFSPTSPTVGQSVTFTATVIGGTPPFTFSWNFVVGPVVTGNPVSHSFDVKGTYSVSLTVNDSSSPPNTVSVSHLITVSPLTLTASMSGPATGTVGATLTYNAVVSGGTAPYTYAWAVTGGSPASGTASSFATSFAVKGTYNVTLNVTDHNAATAKAFELVAISPLPLTADFTVSPSTPCVASPVTFTGSVSGGSSPYTFSWGFGDGTTATSNPTTHVYSVLGTFTVTLNVTDRNIFRTSVSHAVTVAGCPQFVIIMGPSSSTVGSAVTFTATAFGGTPPFFFSWSFGDGTPNVVGQTVSHSYFVKGTYTIRVNATDSSGRITSASNFITIFPLPLAAGFTISPTSPTAGQPVIFTGRASGGTTPYILSWNFGDGTTGTQSQVAHTYSLSGTYTVILNVTDLNNNRATVTRDITVGPPLPPLSVGFIFSPPSPTVNSQVSFTATVTGGTPPYILTWNFGDGTSTTGFASQVTHTYSIAGTFTITLSVTDANGAIQTGKPATIAVNDFSISPNPTKLSLPPETSTTTTIALTSINGFTGNISLNTTITPTGKQGPFLTLSTTSVTISPGTPGTILLTVAAKGSTPLGNYTIEITAISGNVSHTITIPVTVTKEH